MGLLKRISFQKKLLIMVAVPLAVLGIVIGALSYQKAGAWSSNRKSASFQMASTAWISASTSRPARLTALCR